MADRAALQIVAGFVYGGNVKALREENDTLRKELARLKLEIFWSSDDYTDPQELMESFNWEIGCACNACRQGDRYNNSRGGMLNDGTDDCLWQPAFERQLDKFGLILSPGEGEVEYDKDTMAPGLNGVTMDRVDAHLAYTGRPGRSDLAIGRKVWAAKSVDDPEIQRYRSFVDSILKPTSVFN